MRCPSETSKKEACYTTLGHELRYSELVYSTLRCSLFVLAAVSACATKTVRPPLASPAISDPAALSGEWTVDLTAKPGDAPYTKPMTLQLRPDGTVSGAFYESTIEAGRWKADRGRICVSFRTTDGEGPYHTAACLVADHVEGQTWAEHRSFLFNWNATRSR